MLADAQLDCQAALGQLARQIGLTPSVDPTARSPSGLQAVMKALQPTPRSRCRASNLALGSPMRSTRGCGARTRYSVSG